MNKTNQILLFVLLLVVIVGAGLFFLDLRNAIPTIPTLPSLPTITYQTATPNATGLPSSATEMAEGGNAIPTMEYVFFTQNDITGLQKYLNDNAKNWLSLSMNIHTGQVFGVTPPQGAIAGKPYGAPPQGAAIWNEVHTGACDWVFPDPLKNPLCMWDKVGYTSVYKGVIVAGVNSDFVLRPTVTLKGDWANSPITKTEGNKTTIYQESTAVVTYTGNICVTGVEQTTFTPIHYSEPLPTENSYTLRVEEKRNVFGVEIEWTDAPPNFNEELMRNLAEGQAKVVALKPENVKTVYGFVEGDMRPGGKFRQAIEAFYTPELAKLFHVKGFEIVFNATRGDPGIRCDGTPVIR